MKQHLELVHNGYYFILERLIGYLPTSEINLVAHQYDGYLDQVSTWFHVSRQAKRTLTPSCRKWGSQNVGIRSKELGLSIE